MRLAPRSAPVLLAIAALAGCGPKRIPGTEIPDTHDTRAIVATIDAYRQAAERRDPGAVLALVSPKYFDDAGTPDPSDDVDYDQLRGRLTNDYAKVVAVHLDISIRKIDVEDDHASAYVFYEERFRVKTSAGDIPKQASDVHRMQFVRDGAGWKFVSGL